MIGFYVGYDIKASLRERVVAPTSDKCQGSLEQISISKCFLCFLQGTFQKTVPELAKRFRALKKEFIVKQRSKAAKWLAENKVRTFFIKRMPRTACVLVVGRGHALVSLSTVVTRRDCGTWY